MNITESGALVIVGLLDENGDELKVDGYTRQSGRVRFAKSGFENLDVIRFVISERCEIHGFFVLCPDNTPLAIGKVTSIIHAGPWIGGRPYFEPGTLVGSVTPDFIRAPGESKEDKKIVKKWIEKKLGLKLLF